MEKEKEAKRKFWNATRIIFVLFLVVGMLIGAIIEHFLIEPGFFTNQLKSELETKTNEWKEMNEQYMKCLKEKGVFAPAGS